MIVTGMARPAAVMNERTAPAFPSGPLPDGQMYTPSVGRCRALTSATRRATVAGRVTVAVCVCAAASDGGLGSTSAEMTTRTASASRRESPLRLGGTSSTTQY